MPSRFAPISLPPEGFLHRPDFVDGAEERALAEAIGGLPLGELRMNGVVARRRVAHFGWSYGYESWRVEPGARLPDWLLPLRARCAAWVGLEPSAFEEALVTRYDVGAGIGWHRDAPAFGATVVGVSLLGPARLRLRPSPDAREVFALELAPRSAYALSGPARSKWQHMLPPVKAPRLSITFRTLRRSARDQGRSGHAASGGADAGAP